MARTNLPVTNLVGEGSLLQPAGTAVDQANGMNIAIQSSAIPAASDSELLILQVANTAASPFTIIVRAGVQPPAFRTLLGDLTITVTNATTRLVGPFDNARHAQADGSINIDFGVGFTGTIAAYLVPRSAF